MDRLYCTLGELIEDLELLTGVSKDIKLMKPIRSATQFIEQRKQFMPLFETRKFSACGAKELLVPPLLAITSITSDGNTLTVGSDYVLEPYERLWQNGPYTRIVTYLYPAFSSLPEGVVITGKWGMYDGEQDLGFTGDLAATSTTDLVMTDGSKLSPGMVLRLGTEQLLVEATGAVSDSTATLNGALDAETEEFAVTDGTKVKVGEVIKVDFEYMRVLDIQTNQVLTARGWNESRRAAHLTASKVYVQRTFTVRRGTSGSTAAIHSGTQVYQVQAPEDVNYLCRQMAALAFKKAKTGYMGRSGNDDLGTGFWVNEFPKNQIEAVMSNYFWGGR